MSTLEQLKNYSNVVADTGDIEAIKKYQPVDATTNPSLLYKAALLPQYKLLLQQSVNWASQQTSQVSSQLSLAIDKFAVAIGCEILNIVPGRVSTEVDARLSFDTEATIAKARELIALYQTEGVDKTRILIKIASTWEGIRAAKILELEGINCNLTLLFSLTQAVACAEAGVFLISPFVGRILDWHKKNSGKEHFLPQDDPGVHSVTEIYRYYKYNKINTLVMGASFRNTGEILELAGCDRLTISPALLADLEASNEVIKRKLLPEQEPINQTISSLDESSFRYALNNNAMATEKLAEGIRNFIADQVKLESVIAKALP